MNRQDKLNRLAQRPDPKMILDDNGLIDGLKVKLEDLTNILDKGVAVNADELLDRLKGIAELENTLLQSQANLKEALQPKPALQIRTKTKGHISYVATAPVGTKTSDPAWRVMRIDDTKDMTVSYADGNANFDNQAINMERLDYS